MRDEVRLLESEKELVHMYNFFKRLPNNELFTITLDEYKFYAKMGEQWGIFSSKGKLIGGLFMYEIPTQLNMLNLYMPEKYRNKTGSIPIKILKAIVTYANNMYVTTKHPEDFKRYIKHVRDDIYKVLLVGN
jgi:hypothetical protein